MKLDTNKILEIVDSPSVLDRITIQDFKLLQSKAKENLLQALENSGSNEEDLITFLEFSKNELSAISVDSNFQASIDVVVGHSFYKFLKLIQLNTENLKMLIYFDSELFDGLNFIEFDKMIEYYERDIYYGTSVLSVLAFAKVEGLDFFRAIFYLADYIFDSTYLQIAFDLYKKSNQPANLYKLKNLFSQFEDIRLSSEASFLIRALIVDLNFRDAFLLTFSILDKKVDVANLRFLLLVQKSTELKSHFSDFVFLTAKFSPFVIEKLLKIRPRFSDEKYSQLLSDLSKDDFSSMLNLLKLFFI